jgi:hypothetical protein
MFGRRKARDQAATSSQPIAQEQAAPEPAGDQLPPLEPMRPRPDLITIENAFLGWNPNSSTSDSLKPHKDPNKEKVFEDEIDPSWRE